MNPFSVPPVAMAAVALYVGHYHLLIYLRRKRHREDLFFALACLGVCCYDVLCAGLYNATSVEAGVRWQRGQFIALPLFTAAILWFAADYTGLKRRFFVYAFSVYSLVVAVVEALDRSTLTWIVERPLVKQIALPFNLRVTYYEADLGVFTAIYGLSGLVVSTYILWITLRYYRSGSRSQARPLLLAMFVLYAAAVNDTAVSQNVYSFVYLIEYGYLALVMIMAFALSRMVVSGAIAEQRLRALVETTSDWVWETDGSAVYTYSSPNIKGLLGYEAQDLIGTTPFDLMPSDEARRLAPALREAMKSGRPLRQFESRARARDGRLVDLERNAEPFFDEKGNLLGYRGIDRDITDRRQAEAARREGDELFRTLVQNSPAGILLVDDGYRCVYVNDEATRILGYATEELEGRDFRTLLDDEAREQATERYREWLKGEAASSRYEVGIRRKDGARRRVDLVATMVRGTDGRVRTMGQILDVTEQRRTEEALRQAHTVVLHSPVVLFRWRAEPGWPVELVSENVSQFGYTPQELLSGSIPYSTLVHPEDLPRVAREVTEHTAAGESSFVQEYRLVTRAGEVRWVDDRTVVEWDTQGAPRRYQGVLMDITERKILERETEERRGFLESILAAAPDAIVTADNRHAILEWNPGARRLFGYSREETIGRRIDDLITGGDASIASEAARWTASLAITAGIDQTETVRCRRDGTPIDVLVSVAPIAAGAERIGVVAIYTDITAQKKAEKEIRRLNVDLEQLVRDRTAELEAANRELEAFAYSVSHDLRSPLRAIDGYTRILSEDYRSCLDENGRRICGVVRRETLRMGALIDDLLALSRIGRAELKAAQIDMQATVEAAFQEVATSQERERIDFRVGVLPSAAGDGALIRQVWVNLLSNAVKFSSGRNPAVIEVSSRAGDGETVFCVRDNGAGFDMQYVDKLFGVFQRLHSESEFEGTGVGLAIVHRIVTRHGGRVWAEGRLDGGALFCFTLPQRGGQP